MGSRIASSGGMMNPSTNVAASWQQRQQSTKDMLSALKSGDLQAAQTAFATIKASTPNLNGNQDPEILLLDRRNPNQNRVANVLQHGQVKARNSAHLAGANRSTHQIT